MKKFRLGIVFARNKCPQSPDLKKKFLNLKKNIVSIKKILEFGKEVPRILKKAFMILKIVFNFQQSPRTSGKHVHIFQEKKFTNLKIFNEI